jgi:hypothetical protein
MMLMVPVTRENNCQKKEKQREFENRRVGWESEVFVGM